MPTINVNFVAGTIEGTVMPGDKQGLIVALETIVEELRVEAGVPHYIEYDEGKIHAGCPIQADNSGKRRDYQFFRMF
jgi:hypothetical protein